MPTQALSPLLEAIVEKHDLPGMVLSVGRGNEPAQTVALGRDGRGVALAPDSLLPVASISKLATALCVLRLADAGKLSIDDELARHLPDAVAARPGARSAP